MPSGYSQVRSVTLGITTHCPYGVGGCWAEIRNGLNLPEAIEAIPQRPDTKTQTFDLHMHKSWVPDPTLFTRNFAKMNVGVDVRGVEAVVQGMLDLEGTNLVLRVNTATMLRLAPLTQKVQWDTKKNRPEPATRGEKQAFKNLRAKFKNGPVSVQVIGPIIKSISEVSGQKPQLTLEVRKFQLTNTGT
jgi:galactose oxidase